MNNHDLTDYRDIFHRMDDYRKAKAAGLRERLLWIALIIIVMAMWLCKVMEDPR